MIVHMMILLARSLGLGWYWPEGGGGAGAEIRFESTVRLYYHDALPKV